MEKITIGVPVYNGADDLAECLECLLAQTYTNLDIRIYDNASTDETGNIALAYASRDPRISYIRHPENIRAMPNFHRVICDATTKYVMLRAHDDLSAPDYVEKLHQALVENPDAKLAVATNLFVRPNGKQVLRKPKLLKRSGLPSIIKATHQASAGWFYGLWDRETLQRDFEAAWANFPHAWALDFLAIYPAILDQAVVAVPHTTFIQRYKVKSYTPTAGTKPRIADMLVMRRQFKAQCLRFIDERKFSLFERAVLKTDLLWFVDKRVYTLKKIIKQKVLGDKAPRDTKNEF